MKKTNKKPAQKKGPTLGHGDHWEALGFSDDALLLFLRRVLDNAGDHQVFSPPWPDAPFAELLHMEWSQKSLQFGCISGVDREKHELTMLSVFPVFASTVEWVVQVDEMLDSYGPFEGLVAGRAASGHPLQWFAPRFGLEASEWRKCGLARVALAGLALRLERFDPAPVIIKEGKLLKDLREALIHEGKDEQAKSPDLGVEVRMDGMRTLYSAHHDHHECIGKILSVRAIRPLRECPGWLLELECLPDEVLSGHVLPLYVFAPGLPPKYTPKRGDLVHGTVWLQGTWKGWASIEEKESWGASP